MTRSHMPYRSRDDIIFEILTAVKEHESKGGTNRMKLLYETRQTSQYQRQYLHKLLDNGLLTLDKTTSREIIWKGRNVQRGDTFHITQKGIKYLLMMDDMKQKMGKHI